MDKGKMERYTMESIWVITKLIKSFWQSHPYGKPKALQ